jgi:peptidoglycan/LPS O-acetylase OafA/YrhL
VHAALVHPIVVFLGRISFSFYILHLIPLEAAQHYLLSQVQGSSLFVELLSLAATVAAILGLAVVTYHLIEVPSRRLGRWVAVQRAGQPAGSRP